MPEADTANRPRCAICDVEMWLTRIIGGAGTSHESYVFECKVCGALTTLASSAAGGAPIEDDL